MTQAYLHGFSDREQQRLVDQARYLAPWVHRGLSYAPGTRLLEIGCGVGAQTEILLERNPDLEILAVDLNEAQLGAARRRVSSPRVRFEKQDATRLSVSDASMDSALLCWMLEHSPAPGAILKEASRILKPGGTLQIREVFNATFWTSPDSLFLKDYWERYNQLQIKLGGDPQIGAKLGGLLSDSGFSDICCQTTALHLDRRDPDSRTRFINYLKELFLSAGPQLLEAGATTEFGLQRVSDEFERLKRHTNSVVYLGYIEASARKH